MKMPIYHSILECSLVRVHQKKIIASKIAEKIARVNQPAL